MLNSIPKYAPLQPLHPGFDDEWSISVALNLCADDVNSWTVCDASRNPRDAATPKTRIGKMGMHATEVGYRQIRVSLTGREYRRMYAELTEGVVAQ